VTEIGRAMQNPTDHLKTPASKGTIRKLLDILDPPFKKRAYLLQFFLMVGVVFESLGLGMIVPLVNAITDAEGTNNNFFVRVIRSVVGNVPATQVIVITLSAFVLFYFIKTIFLSFLVWKQTEFTQSLARNVSNRLFSGYIHQPYVFFLDKNSGVLMKNIVSEVGTFTGYLQSFMQLQTEFSVLIGIVVTLLFLEPVGALVIFAFVGGISYLLVRATKKRVTTWGQSKQNYDAWRSKTLLQGLTGVSELKLFRKEKFFLKKYAEYNKYYFELQRKSQFMQQVQRFYLEFILIISFVVLCLAVMLQGKSIAQILPSLSLFLVASLRMLPSANRIIANLQAMRFTKAGVNLIHDEFNTFRYQDKAPEIYKNTLHEIKQGIQLDDISYSYPDSTRKALDSVSLYIKSGSVAGIIGQSGSGKTTLVNIMSGLLQPGSGRLLVDDLDVTHSPWELQQLIGYVPQTIFLVDDTLKRNIAFGIPDEAIDEQRVQEVIDAAQLENVVANMSEGLDTIVGERGLKLSGGQRQRIGIARALYHRPQLLILDEGTSALDTETETYIMESVANLKGKLTILLIAHRYSTLHICDIVYKMEDGRIIRQGKLEELI
jgi:ABC-type multidrug transport system fused ATPase/permease subunit